MRRRRALPMVLVLAIAGVAALLALHDHVRYYRITSGSMEPTLTVGARIAVEPGLGLHPGEIVAFRAPAGAAQATPVCGAMGEGTGFAQPCGLATPGLTAEVLTKRIVAGPGQLVALRGGQAVVDDRPRAESFSIRCSDQASCDFPTAIRVPAGSYFVLGDNRGVSDDSRFWGPVPAAAVLGVVVRCGPLQTACQPIG